MEGKLFLDLILIFQGDSGGPLTVEVEGQHILVGVVSYGARNCEQVRDWHSIIQHFQPNIFRCLPSMCLPMLLSFGTGLMRLYQALRQ